MNIVIKEKQQVSERKLNLRQEMFCKLFATDPKFLGNGAKVYQKVYGGLIETAKTNSSRFLDDPRITARINSHLDTMGFNDYNIDRNHLFLINQKKDLNVSMKGIEHYNKLKKRVDNTLTVIIPKPVMELDDDEVIHKIDKGKARDISQE